MKTIELTQGQVALVDDECFEELNQHKWCAHKCGNTFYAQRNTLIPKRTIIHMHRAIVNTPKGLYTDHIDGNGLNNCKSNLRIVTNRQNSQNQHVKKSSIYIGVTWDKTNKKWQAQIMIKGKVKFLGRFEVETEAFEAYLKALATINEVCVNNIISEVTE